MAEITGTAKHLSPPPWCTWAYGSPYDISAANRWPGSMPAFIGMSAHTALHLSNLEMALHDSMCSSLNMLLYYSAAKYTLHGTRCYCMPRRGWRLHCAPWPSSFHIMYVWPWTTHLACNEAYFISGAHLTFFMEVVHVVTYTPHSHAEYWSV